MLNPYKKLREHIEQTYNAQFVTNSWLKLYEILFQTRIAENSRCIVKDSKTLRVFFNAELPGSFIFSMNHYLCTFCPDTYFDWIASSLAPDRNKNAFKDTNGICSRNKNKWLMLRGKHTGDIRANAVLETLKNQIKETFNGPVDLYISDCGIDPSNDYYNQEEQFLSLNLRQVFLGILSIRKGGSMIFKQYTFNTTFSVSLICLLVELFESVFAIKPMTSKCTNSEVYFVCKGYKVVNEDTYNSIIELLMYNEVYPENYVNLNVSSENVKNLVNVLRNISKEIFLEKQIVSIQTAVRIFEKLPGIKARKEMLELAEKGGISKYMSTYDIWPLETRFHIKCFEHNNKKQGKSSNSLTKKKARVFYKNHIKP